MRCAVALHPYQASISLASSQNLLKSIFLNTYTLAATIILIKFLIGLRWVMLGNDQHIGSIVAAGVAECIGFHRYLARLVSILAQDICLGNRDEPICHDVGLKDVVEKLDAFASFQVVDDDERVELVGIVLVWDQVFVSWVLVWIGEGGGGCPEVCEASCWSGLAHRKACCIGLILVVRAEIVEV